MSFIDTLIDTVIHFFIGMIYVAIVGGFITIPILAIVYHSAWYLLLIFVWLALMAFGRWVMENY